MPSFAMPVMTGKRKAESSQEGSRKRQTPAGGYYVVQWRNPQTKKHKTWEGDGVLVVEGTRGKLYDTDSKFIGSGSVTLPVLMGDVFSMGSKDVSIELETTREEYYSGRCFGTQPMINSSPGPAPPLRTSNPASAYRPPRHSIPLAQPRKSVPLQGVSLFSASQASSSDLKENIGKFHWSVNYRNVSKKGKEVWDGDAFVVLEDKKATLLSDTGKKLGTCLFKTGARPDALLYFGSREVRLVELVKPSDIPNYDGDDDDEIQIIQTLSVKEETPAPAPKKFDPPVPKGIPAASFYAKREKKVVALHNPQEPNAVVMKQPSEAQAKRYNTKQRPIIDVVLDPNVTHTLRPHQVEGIKFMYECVMGLRKHEGQGCILADEMGLGKTLQTIILVWTLLKQNPYGGGPTVQKVLVVCPVSLINNWKAEFRKWLGRDRVGVTVCDKAGDHSVNVFINSKQQQVLIIGYERLRTVMNKLTSCVPPIGLIICDEGHRLKSASNKTTSMFGALKTPRRVILSGTPIQNDLGEFHAMADFCNPGLLETYATFKKVYESPILKSRDPQCSSKEAELGEARSAELLNIAKSFVLRREATILGNYLPPKHEYVVFITPTELQLAIFDKVLHMDKFDDLVQSAAESLALINMLTKVSNSPILLKAMKDKAEHEGKTLSGASSVAIQAATRLIPAGAQIEDMTLSGKLVALSRLLGHVKEKTEEKCVLVSNYTSTLEILEAFCRAKRYSFLRLDGSTPTAKRQEYVNLFNKSSQKSTFIFLLSSKAGGVGINLIGGSRLVLFDSDWNPSHDLQAMARCHRDGQKRPVFIYRFLTAGTIDEKIFQRQVTKLGLSDSLMSANQSSKSDAFTRKDLRDIFRIQPDTACNTHEIIECPCDRIPGASQQADEDEDMSEDEGDGPSGFMSASQVNPKKLNKSDKEYMQKKKEALASLGQWKHINCLLNVRHDDVRDDVLRDILHSDKKKQAVPSSLKGAALLDALDLDNVAQASGVRSVRDLPGGSVSFVFERSSDAPIVIPKAKKQGKRVDSESEEEDEENEEDNQEEDEEDAEEISDPEDDREDTMKTSKGKEIDDASSEVEVLDDDEF
ncbi:hypothetical protein CYLTODRAFT_438881 [Cylindrobasidium torrendii FP15055 ss-10]|uniref:DNA repair and recombination protein RAD54B n=1 Tax=Cylindrobasidium torrendii FP15055 ss-10 TaxID=1314674 RepID=A0A0D7AVT1_9AGAR|nr:hypothetical protein CYLTODRAFT_438881 [Cylindrobasidium torrendii FP15055 ss-10]